MCANKKQTWHTCASIELLLNQNKEILAKWVSDFTCVLARSQQVLRNVSGKFDEMKDTIISLQSTTIQNQEQLLEVKCSSLLTDSSPPSDQR